MRPEDGAPLWSGDLPYDGGPELVTLSVDIAMVFRPALYFTSKVVGILEIGQRVGPHPLDLVGDGVVQARFVSFAVDGRQQVRPGLGSAFAATENEVRARDVRQSGSHGNDYFPCKSAFYTENGQELGVMTFCRNSVRNEGNDRKAQLSGNVQEHFALSRG